MLRSTSSSYVYNLKNLKNKSSHKKPQICVFRSRSSSLHISIYIYDKWRLAAPPANGRKEEILCSTNGSKKFYNLRHIAKVMLENNKYCWPNGNHLGPSVLLLVFLNPLFQNNLVTLYFAGKLYSIYFYFQR